MLRDAKGRFIRMIKNENGGLTLSKRGGFRVGSGRKRQDPAGQERKKHSIYCTLVELEKIREYLKKIREKTTD